jgi:hypothetical protein
MGKTAQESACVSVAADNGRLVAAPTAPAPVREAADAIRDERTAMPKRRPRRVVEVLACCGFTK